MSRFTTAVAAGTFAGCLWSSTALSQQRNENAAAAAVVAVAAGRPVTLAQPSRETVQNYFYFLNRRAPDPAADGEALAQAELAWRCAQLNQRVSTLAEELAKTRFAVSVSEEELRSAGQARLRQLDPESEAARMRAANAPVAAALEEVYERGASPDEVYQSTVRQLGITEDAWRIHVYLGREPAYRARLRQAAAVTGTALAGSIRDARPAVENQKLRAAIDREIGLKDPGFQADRELVENGGAPSDGRTAAAVRERVIAARARWWDDFYASLKVEILDAGLKASCKVAPPRWQ